MHAHLLGTKSLLTLYQIINKPDFPYLANEIVEPRPDMNIKVAAFTVSEKSSNIRASQGTFWFVLFPTMYLDFRFLLKVLALICHNVRSNVMQRRVSN